MVVGRRGGPRTPPPGPAPLRPRRIAAVHHGHDALMRRASIGSMLVAFLTRIAPSRASVERSRPPAFMFNIVQSAALFISASASVAESVTFGPANDYDVIVERTRPPSTLCSCSVATTRPSKQCVIVNIVYGRRRI